MKPKRAELGLPPAELAAIRATVEFANRRVESVEQVEAIFRAAALPRDVWQTIPAEDVSAFRDNDQREVRDWLAQIIAKGNVNPRVRKEVAQRVKAIRVSAASFSFEDGRLLAHIQPAFSGVQACYAFAIARLVSRDAEKLAHRLGRCEHCGRFFFDERRGPGKRRRKFCSYEHKNARMQWSSKNSHKPIGDQKRWQVPALPK